MNGIQRLQVEIAVVVVRFVREEESRENLCSKKKNTDLVFFFVRWQDFGVARSILCGIFLICIDRQEIFRYNLLQRSVCYG